MIGKTILHYKILEKLGEGGMGVVYKAEDTKLKRDVAIKFLPRQIVASDEERERFKIEAQAAAALNHPNIATIHAIEEVDDEMFIVMEYIEGSELRKIVGAHCDAPMPIKEIIDYATQIASGLQAAHEKDVTHRDIKSANIMVTDKGQIKIMDFGLAKVRGGAQVTKVGTTLGTAAYMSPEQAQGMATDHRTDIWAFGIVLYEMLTGKMPFPGDYEQAVIYAILNEEPPSLTSLGGPARAQLQDIVTNCLEKDARRRFQNAGQILDRLHKLTTVSTLGSGSRSALSKWAAPTGLVLVATLVYWMMQTQSSQLEIKLGRTQQFTRAPELELDPTLSPDGKMITYAAGPKGEMNIYVRQRTATRAILLSEGTMGTHRWPQWSPDGTKITFQSTIAGSGESAIYSVPALGGIPRKLVETPWISGHTWSPDAASIAYTSNDTIFVRTLKDAYARRLAAAPDPHSVTWSPDGSRIAYVSGNSAYTFGIHALGNIAPTSIWVVSAENGATVQVTDRNDLSVSPAWLPDSEHLLFISNRDGSRDIYQQAVSHSGTLGPAIRLTSGLNVHTLSLSSDGKALAYSRFDYSSNIWSIPIPEKGTMPTSEAKPLTFGNQTIEAMSILHDGEWLAFDSNINGNQDIYKMPIEGGEPRQLTSHAADDFVSSWSPDSKKIAFHSFRNGTRDIYVMSEDGGSPQRLTDDSEQEIYPDWSPDGREIVFASNRTGVYELCVISRKQGDAHFGTPRRLTFDGGRNPRWSPDGGLIAYPRAESIRVISPEGGNPKVLVETRDSANLPTPDAVVWSSDSQTIYYKAFDDKGESSIWSIPISGGEPRLLVRFDDPERQSHRPEFATDGSNFYFTMGEQESDIWLMELLP